MHCYRHKVHYYETDRMGITHHSNYIRWMEEARVDFLDSIGWGYDKLEADSIISPVISINCEYKNSTTFNDEIMIEVGVKEYKGARLTISYIMKNEKTGRLIAVAESKHCFLNKHGRPVILKKEAPQFSDILAELVMD